MKLEFYPRVRTIRKGKEESYIFGFEESYGYLTGSYVRDKDVVNGALMICEMFSFYKTNEISLIDKLCDIYEKYGYCMNTLHSFEFEGESGFLKMQRIMRLFRKNAGANKEIAGFGGKRIESITDYAAGVGDLHKSDVLKYALDGNCSLTVRPSGTEPKLKIYVSVSEKDREKAQITEQKIIEDVFKIIND